MKHEKIKLGVIGRFGFGQDLVNGQTIKTKVIVAEAKKLFGEQQVAIADTYGSPIKTPLFLCRLCNLMFKCKNVVLMPAHKGIRVFAPFISAIKKFYHCRIHYVVIGAWLTKMLESDTLLKRSLYAFDYIYVETISMKERLEQFGYQNIVLMPNFKELEICDINNIRKNFGTVFPFCILSRITEKKGIEDAVKVIEEINASAGKTVCSLDIYGMIDEEYKTRFDEMQRDFPEFIRYRGIVPFEKTTEVLKDYYALLFPTKYYTEGIPGTIIDAYSAGVPVIASAWENVSDIVENEVNGLVYAFDNNDAMRDAILRAIKSEHQWETMRVNCLHSAEKFMSSNVIHILTDRML